MSPTGGRSPAFLRAGDEWRKRRPAAARHRLGAAAWWPDRWLGIDRRERVVGGTRPDHRVSRGLGVDVGERGPGPGLRPIFWLRASFSATIRIGLWVLTRRQILASFAAFGASFGSAASCGRRVLVGGTAAATGGVWLSG